MVQTLKELQRLALLCQLIKTFYFPVKRKLQISAREFGSCLAALKRASTHWEMKYFDTLTQKCQSFPKYEDRKLSTRLMLTNGCGPFVEMKLSISVVLCFSARVSVEVCFKFETSTSTTASLKDRLRNRNANALTFLQCL